MSTSRRLACVLVVCLLMSIVPTRACILGGDGAALAATPASAANGKIFFRVTTGDKKNVLYSTNPDGSDLHKLVEVTHRDGPFTISPDGKHILFYTDEPDGTSKLHLMDADGSNVRPFADLGDLAWSPDSQWVAGIVVDQANSITHIVSNIVIASIDGSTTKQLTDDNQNNNGARDNREPAWSPDSKSILYTAEEAKTDQLHLMNSDGSDPHLLSPIPVNALEQPQWSPDGKSIAVLSGTSAAGDFKLVVLNADGSNPRELTKPVEHVHISDPRWSPDGKHILYILFDLSTDVDSHSLVLVDADGSNAHTLASDAKLSGWPPAWSPDGTQIAFVMQDGETFGLYVMNADGSNPHKVQTASGDCTYVLWQGIS